jgi:hypothetical protein
MFLCFNLPSAVFTRILLSSRSTHVRVICGQPSFIRVATKAKFFPSNSFAVQLLGLSLYSYRYIRSYIIIDTQIDFLFLRHFSLFCMILIMIIRMETNSICEYLNLYSSQYLLINRYPYTVSNK